MKILITGGAGFIGSNLVEALLLDKRVALVRVLDNLSTGYLHNIENFFVHPNFQFIKGDICDYDTCMEACDGIDLIAHQAALGSVPRSIEDPLKTNEVNITGFLNVFTAAKEQGIKRIVYAASSSTYGDDRSLTKVEERIGKPLSPYAITKVVNELYADVYANLFDIEYIGLRYFNVFGPRQDPNGAYAAVIPIFMQAALSDTPPVINGDGSISRDFTFIDNVVQANLLSLFTQEPRAVNQIYNVACGDRTPLSQLWQLIKEITGSKTIANYGPNRAGDIAHSQADINKIKTLLNYRPTIKLKSGLVKAYHWYKQVKLEKIRKEPVGIIS